MIGAYGNWASRIAADPPRLSFRRPEFKDVTAWKRRARARFTELLLPPGPAGVPKVTVQHAQEFDGLSIEHLSWQLSYGPPTEAVLLKPLGAKGKLPGVVGLHDHGGNESWRAEDHDGDEGSASADGEASGALLQRKGMGE